MKVGHTCRFAGLAAGITALVVTLSPAYAGRQAGEATQPIRGGTMTTRLILTPQCVGGGMEGSAFIESLVTTDSRGRIQPLLATRWSFSHGGRWLTFTLRRGLRFSNGDRLDAAAVRLNFLPVSPPLQKVVALNTTTVRFIYSVPFRPAVQINGLAGIMDTRAMKAEGKSAACTRPIASGPFKVQSTGPGLSSMTFVRNPYHTWSAPWLHNHGTPYLSRVIFKPIVDDTQAVNELLAGDVDLTRISPAVLPRLRGSSDITIHTQAEMNELYLGFNWSHRPFNNPAVRRAIAEAIDRHALIKVALSGYGVPAYSALAPSQSLYDPHARSYAIPYRPAAAQRVLKAHHVTGPYTLEDFNIPAFAQSGELIQAELAQVGVRVKLVVKAPPDAYADLSRGAFDMVFNIAGGNDDPYTYFHSSQTPKRTKGTGQNWGYVQDPALDRLIMATRTTIKPGAVRTALDRLQRYMDQHTILDPLYSRVLVGATRNRVHGFELPGGYAASTGFMPFWQDVWVTK